MGRFSFVMFLKALFEIGSHADIALMFCGGALDKINVRQYSPSFALASEGVLLRANRTAGPAKRRGCAKQDGGGEIRTHEAFRPSGFQDRRDQPLCHPSGKLVITNRWASIAGTQTFARQ